MLGKLTKHELNATSRFLFPIYIALIVLAVVGKFFIWLSSKQSFIDSVPASFAKVVSVFSSFLTVIYILLIIASFIMTFIYLIMRFHKNYFTDEGYLMFTLPVNTKSLISAKLIAAFLWTLLNIVVVLASLFIIMYSKDFSNSVSEFYDAAKDFLLNQRGYVEDKLGVSFGGFVTEIIFLVLINLISYYLLAYTSMAFGQSVSKNHRVIGSIISAVVIIVIIQIVTGIVYSLVSQNVPDNTGEAVQVTIITSYIINIVLCTAFFFITDHILKKKLDLE